MKSVHQFFLFCSGIDASILEKCPTDRNKYVGIGATVFFTGVLAFFSSSYALYTVFDSTVAAVAFGLVWGLMIFNLDRYIVMSMKSQGKWWRDLLVAAPRVMLAVLLALVISKPLELKIFEKEINAELVVMEQELYKTQEDKVKDRFSAQITALRDEITTLKTEIAQKSAARDTLVRAAVQEADGTGGSRNRNLGPIYRAKKDEADLANAELTTLIATNQPLIQAKEAEIAKLDSNTVAGIAGLDRSRYDGMASRMEALSRLTAGSQAILYASIFITLLFIAIETSPILVKLISYRSPYDYVLHEHEQVYQMTNLEKTTLLSNSVKNRLRYETETGLYLLNAKIAAEKALIDEKLQEKLASLKQEPFSWSLRKS